MTTLNKSTTSKINEIKQHIKAGIDSWVKAGECVRDLLDDGLTHDDIADKCGIPDLVVTKLELLGRGRVLPQLMLASYPAASFLPRLPLETQSRAVNEGVDVLLTSGDTLRVTADNLTRQQCQQVFDNMSLRSVSAQRAWIESEKTSQDLKRAPKAHGLYQVRGNKVLIPGACQLTQKDLVRMLSEISQ